MKIPDLLDTLHHDGSPLFVTRTGPRASIRVRASASAPIDALFIRTCPDGEQTFTPLERLKDASGVQWWEVTIPLAVPRTHYRFLARTAAGNWWLTGAGLVRHTPTDATDFTILPAMHTPAWVRDAVFYQIFPDRFADGDPSNNVPDGAPLGRGRTARARRWGELPNKHGGAYEFFGGDLQGIAQQLPYLQDLGITALYLNPIFTAPSSHKYDVADYDTVDPHLGGEQGLIALREALDEQGMYLMLDVVPNHCGASHHWFTSAQADSAHPAAEYFTFVEHPHTYESWLGVPSLPKLNYRSEALREAMYAGDGAILRRWLRPPYRIDAWRLDVANMLARQGDSQLGHKVGRGIRRAVKQENPDMYLLGENFFDGTPHLQGEELDATMNYRGFGMPLLHWLAGHDAAYRAPHGDTTPLPGDALVAQWRGFMAGIPWQIAAQQFNLLGSHDTRRVRTVLGGDLAKVQTALVVLFAYPGVPCVYYGDEIGLEGEDDPDCRRTMPWDEAAWNHDLRALTKRLIAVRRTAPALRWGGIRFLHPAEDTVAFVRESVEQRLIVVARRAADDTASLDVRTLCIADGTRFRELLSGAEAVVQHGALPLTGLGACGAQLWEEAA